jgi:hypothetical protein
MKCDGDDFTQAEDAVERALRPHFIRKLNDCSFLAFRQIIKNSFKEANLKRQYILDRTNETEWHEGA